MGHGGLGISVSMKNVAHSSCFYIETLRVHCDVESLENERTASMDLKFAVIFLFQIVLGAWGNLSLLLYVPFLQWMQAKVLGFDSRGPDYSQLLCHSFQRNPRDNGSF